MNEIEELIEQLNDPNDVQRRIAIFDLEEVGEPAIAPLVAAVNDERVRIRLGAIASLGRIIANARETSSSWMYSLAGIDKKPQEQVIDGLTRCMSDSHSGVRELAARTLGSLGSAALPAITSCFTSDDPSLLQSAAIAIGEVGHDGFRASPQLIKLLVHPEPAVRLASATALGKVTRGIDALVKHLHQATKLDRHLTESLVIALRETGASSDEAYLAFVDAFSVGDFNIRKAAADAIRIIDPNATISPYKPVISSDNIRKDIAIEFFTRFF